MKAIHVVSVYSSTAALLGLAANAGLSLTTTSKPPAPTSLVIANNEFGFDLLHGLQRAQPGLNVLISPYGIATALAMTRNGAAGSTLEAISHTLHLAEPDWLTDSAALRDSLKDTGPMVELDVANSLWAAPRAGLHPGFVEASRRFFGADVSELELAGPQAVSTINVWGEANTHHKIKEILHAGSLSPHTELVLVNAVYFKGRWRHKFDLKQTANRPFHPASDKILEVPMMTQNGNYQYFSSAQFSAAGLPYADGRFSLYLLLPGEGSNLDDVIQKLTIAEINSAIHDCSSQPGTISLPRFSITYDRELTPDLSELGMAVAFDSDRADFSAMATKGLFIDKVQHRAVLEVNEEGSEAASSTAVVMARSVARRPFKFVVNRPFLAILRDNRSGTILFLGAVYAPQKVSGK